MVALVNNEIKNIPLEQAVNRLKLVDPNGGYVTIAKDIGVRFGD
jgi:hypothetical protein